MARSAWRCKFHRVASDVVNGQRRPTKREMLSLTMSVYDPLMLANFMVAAKILLHETWTIGVAWDDPIPSVIHERWAEWLKQLPRIAACQLPRCYSPSFTISSEIELHLFADASESAVAAVGYWRVRRSDGKWDVSFVTGNTRCAPRNILSIPRLERQAAVLAVRLSNTIQSAHECNISRVVYWTDARTVISWVRSQNRRFKPFVAHRIAEIIEDSAISNWRWLPTIDNVADDATRAVWPLSFDAKSRWLYGPHFLRCDEQTWPQEPTGATPETTDTSEELPQKFVLHAAKGAQFVDMQRFSDYNRLRRAMAYVIRFAHNTQAKKNVSPRKTGELQPTELSEADRILSQLAQGDAYARELGELRTVGSVARSSDLHKLVPMLDDFGTMRMHGRIDAARYLPDETRRPIIFPQKHPLTALVARHYHIRMRLTIRAVRLELAADLSTDACIICIRNFVNLRGVPVRIRRNNGTNFVGAARELKEQVDAFDQQAIAQECSNRGIEWRFNVPSNPEAGGCWERMVRSVKRVLTVTLKETAPRVETLRSLLLEAANIINARPLPHLPVEGDEEEPLTPNHFLLGVSSSTQTPEPVDPRAHCLRKQWRIAQDMKNRFWQRWVVEYLPDQTRRTKWFRPTAPLTVGALVVVCDADQPRSRWPRGRITEVFAGADGQIRSARIRTQNGELRRPAS